MKYIEQSFRFDVILIAGGPAWIKTGEACNAPRIAHAFAARMPHATLKVVSTDYLTSSGDVDLAFSPEQAVQPSMRSAALFEEEAALVARRRPPAGARANDKGAIQRLDAHRCARRLSAGPAQAIA
jgi:DNA-binding transcriptional LysR family regulator